MVLEKTKEQLSAFKLFLNKEFVIVLGIYFVFTSFFSSLAVFLFHRFEFLKEIEIVVQYFIFGFRDDLPTTVLKIFTDFGGAKSMAFLVLLASGFFFWKKRYLYSLGIIFSVGIAEFVSLVVKNIVGRGRPPASLSLVSEYDPSFPSGHTIVAISFYGFLMYVIYKNIQHTLLRIFLMFLCGGMILLAGFARVYLGAHFPGDVIASYVLGGVWVIFVIYLLKRQENIPEGDK